MFVTPLQYHYVAQFACLQGDCPAMCCTGWSMPSDARQRQALALTAPTLLEAIDARGQFKQVREGGDCVNLHAGMCAIHAKFGSELLSDSCHFYPRVVRQLGNQSRVAAMLSCPETLRLLLAEATPFALTPTEMKRTPTGLRDRKPAAMAVDEAWRTVDFFIARVGDAGQTAEMGLLKLIALADHDLPSIDLLRWKGALDLLPPARPQPNNPQMLLYTLALLIATAPKVSRPALDTIFKTMEVALHCRMDWETRIIHPDADSGHAYAELHARWNAHGKAVMAPVLQRWLQAQLAIAAFPFGGIFATHPVEGVRYLSLRFAIMRLALMCHAGADGEPPDMTTSLRVIQSLSRFIDHTADNDLLQLICRDAGWSDLPGLRGLVES